MFSWSQHKKELKGLTLAECLKKQEDLQKSLFQANLKKRIGDLGDLKDIRMAWKLRKQLARLKGLETQLRGV